MSLINTQDLTRHFKLLNRREGLKGAVLDLFSRDYRIIEAVKNVSMKIDEGEVVGFIGPNGAGKSTTIKMLTGLLVPTTGTVNVDGFNPYRQRKTYMKKIGIVFGQRSQLWWEVPVIESYKLLKAIYSIDDKTFQGNIDLFNQLVNLKDLYHTPARNLSLGQRILCDIAASFLHNPKVIFLDEPTIGLDVNIKKKVRKIIKDLNSLKKTTIVLTSHDTGDIEELAKRIILIDKGSIIYDGSIKDFNNIFGSYRTIKVSLKSIDTEIIESIIKLLGERYPNGIKTKLDPGNEDWFNITVNEEQVDLTSVLNFLLNSYKVKDVKIEDVELERVIQRVYDGGLK